MLSCLLNLAQLGALGGDVCVEGLLQFRLNFKLFRSEHVLEDDSDLQVSNSNMLSTSAVSRHLDFKQNAIVLSSGHTVR